ncbi:unnamed protein product [Cuscuta campestris]|uniref:Pectin acetylesterase n=1 Tax=Cuscuta campestris TaxID=132261 RepID=A0A484KKE3_9ASTE|nr:unnamed protein product [Cuscuta campestris]
MTNNAGAFLLDRLDISRTPHIEQFYDDVVTTHGSANSLPGLCTSKMKAGLVRKLTLGFHVVCCVLVSEANTYIPRCCMLSQCFFPQNMARYTETPLFLVNSAYDVWQIWNILVPDVVDQQGTWLSCKLNSEKCSDAQLQTLHG